MNDGYAAPCGSVMGVQSADPRSSKELKPWEARMNLTVHQSVVDPSIYKLADEFADYVRAHAIIESNETVTAIGDGGQAFGLLQMHPAFVEEYIRFANITVHDTWPEAEVKMCAAFYSMRIHANVALDLVVQGYNLGWKAVVVDGQRNPIYLSRWHEALNKIHGGA